MKKKTSRLKRAPERISFPADDGHQVLLVPEAMIAGLCQACKAPPFYVASRIGLMSCPHCGASSDKIQFGWGKQQIIFVPEHAEGDDDVG